MDIDRVDAAGVILMVSHEVNIVINKEIEKCHPVTRLECSLPCKGCLTCYTANIRYNNFLLFDNLKTASFTYLKEEYIPSN